MIPKRIQPAQRMEAATIRGMRRAIPVLAALVALAVSFCIAPLAARAQDSKLAEGPPPPPPEESSSQPAPAPVDPASSGPAKPDEESSSQPVPLPPSHSGPAPISPDGRPTIRLRPDPGEAAAPAPAVPVLDPVGAARSLDVGNFYLKKGDYDAAIDRFQEAAQRQPKLAKPYLLMGEAYEKKNDPSSAVTAYRKYLQLFPKAPDQDKVNKRIEKLTELESKRDNGH